MLYIHKRSYGLEIHRFRGDHGCSEVDFHKLADNARLQPKSYKIGELEFIGGYNLHEKDGMILNDPFRNEKKDKPSPFSQIYDLYWRKAGSKMTFEEWLAVIPRARTSRDPAYHALLWDKEQKLYYLTLPSDKGVELTLIEESSVIVDYKVHTLASLVEQRRVKLNNALETLDRYDTLLAGRHIYDLERAPDENNRLAFSDWIVDLTRNRI